MKERIQKVLANAGVASRRASEDLVREGRVEVNGKVRRDLPILVDPSVDEIRVDGTRIGRAGLHAGVPPGKGIYILLNKPPNVVCTNVAQTTAGRRQTRAIDLLPPGFSRRVYPVGRLDASSRGLLLLTDDGELTQRLTHPSYGVAKTYRVVCDGDVSPATLLKLREGVWLAERESGQGFKTHPAHIKLVRRARDKSTLEITIKEGRNRQIRRMLAALGHKVRDLKRVRIGPLKLEKLPEGASRLLQAHELRELKESLKMGRKPRPRPDRVRSRQSGLPGS
jgi:23S rRNA pseudouridine2605 synthase